MASPPRGRTTGLMAAAAALAGGVGVRHRKNQRTKPPRRERKGKREARNAMAAESRRRNR